MIVFVFEKAENIVGNGENAVYHRCFLKLNEWKTSDNLAYIVCMFQGLSDDVEIAKLTRERDEMRQLLDKFERHMAEVCCFNCLPNSKF